jgi:hypothetical protein
MTTPSFEVGDRVKLWGKSTDIGTVDEVWKDGKNTMVTVVWEASGCASDVRAHQLQFAPLPAKSA